MAEKTPDEIYKEWLKANEELVQFAYSIATNVKPNEGSLALGSKNWYFYGLYLGSIAQLNGLLSLLHNKQIRVSTNNVRTLMEINLNARLCYCTESDVFVKVINKLSEHQKLNQQELLIQDGVGPIDQSTVDKQKARVASIESYMEETYPDWEEVVPDTCVSAKTKPSTLKSFSIRDRCLVIDHFEKLDPATNRTAYEYYYRRVYPYYSLGTHADAFELGLIFENVGEATFIDVEGTKDIEGGILAMKFAYSLVYEMLEYFYVHMLKEDVSKIPAWIKMGYKDSLV